MKGQEAERPGRVAWLVLVYRLPANSGLKSTIRRQLTARGAIYPSNAVATMPDSPAAERAFRRLRHMIGEAGGSAQLLRAEAIDGESDLIAAFNEAREREYAEILAGCGDFAAGIENMTAVGHFRYSDLGEKDAELKRLTMRNDAIRMRDALRAARADSALSWLARCRVILDGFAGRVYQADAASTLIAQELFQPTIRDLKEEEALGEDEVSNIRDGSSTSPNRRSSEPKALPGSGVGADGGHALLLEHGPSARD